MTGSDGGPGPGAEQTEPVSSKGLREAMTGDLATGWHDFGTAIALVEPRTGFMVAAVFAIWLSAFLADGFGFRAGAGPEMLVGLHVERSVDMAVGLLGILKSGAAYVPSAAPTTRTS